MDVVALLPSMQSATTGRIVREHVLKSPLKIDGFDWKQGARYIMVNKNYTGNLKCLWNVLPWKRKVGGTAPGMKAKELNSKKGNVETQWSFPRRQPTDQQIREIQARVAEIGVRFLFGNFPYRFSGDGWWTNWCESYNGGSKNSHERLGREMGMHLETGKNSDRHAGRVCG